MSRSNHQPPRAVRGRRWSFITAVLLIAIVGHWTLATGARAEAPAAASSVTRDSDRSPDHAFECAFGSRLVSLDRVRVGSIVLDAVGPVPAPLTVVGAPLIQPAIQSPALASDARRAFLQVFLI